MGEVSACRAAGRSTGHDRGEARWLARAILTTIGLFSAAMLLQQACHANGSPGDATPACQAIHPACLKEGADERERAQLRQAGIQAPANEHVDLRRQRQAMRGLGQALTDHSCIQRAATAGIAVRTTPSGSMHGTKW